MILEYEEFAQKLNNKLFAGSYKKLLETIVDKPDRYLGIYRPSKPKTKIIQNITQSHEIKFGDALEDIFEEYFEKLGFELLPQILKKEETTINKRLDIDQLIKKGSKIYLIEQKIRDDHDSTKKEGQFENFKKKYKEISIKYPNCEVIPIMWFIDASLQKNKGYYEPEMEKMTEKYGCLPRLCYGEELFERAEDSVTDISIEMWNEVNEYLTRWQETLPDMYEIDFDAEAEEVFEEIKNMSPDLYQKLFDNEGIVEQILPILFTTGEVLKKLREYFRENNYDELYEKVNRYILNNFGEE